MTEFEPYLWPPAPTPSLAVAGRRERLPVRRIFLVGRNYAAHAAEMGFAVDKARDARFYFTKSAQALLESGHTVPMPTMTRNYHHEVELVVALGAAGHQLSVSDAASLIYGYAVGLDMTRRDLQLAAREQGRPWDTAKDVEHSAVVGAVAPLPGQVLSQGAISLTVNGQMRQQADLGQLVWSVPELIADLSRYYHLEPGDLLFTGTPEGVGPVVAGDHLRGEVAGVGVVELTLA